jgi:hypothetical protein
MKESNLKIKQLFKYDKKYNGYDAVHSVPLRSPWDTYIIVSKKSVPFKLTSNQRVKTNLVTVNIFQFI